MSQIVGYRVYAGRLIQPVEIDTTLEFRVARLLEENRRGEADNGKRIWALLVLESWLRQYEVTL